VLTGVHSQFEQKEVSFGFYRRFRPFSSCCFCSFRRRTSVKHLKTRCPGDQNLQQTLENAANTLGISKEQVVSAIEQAALLKLPSTVANTARLADFLASDGAATLTGAIVNASGGTVID